MSAAVRIYWRRETAGFIYPRSTLTASRSSRREMGRVRIWWTPNLESAAQVWRASGDQCADMTTIGRSGAAFRSCSISTIPAESGKIRSVIRRSMSLESRRISVARRALYAWSTSCPPSAPRKSAIMLRFAKSLSRAKMHATSECTANAVPTWQRTLRVPFRRSEAYVSCPSDAFRMGLCVLHAARLGGRTT